MHITSKDDANREIVRMGDPVPFGVSLYNNPDEGVDYLNAYLDIIIPDSWRFIEVTTAGLSAVQQGNGNTFRISGIDLPKLSIQEISYTVQPLCEASVANDTVRYSFYSNAEVLIAQNKFATVGIMRYPTLNPNNPVPFVSDWLGDVVEVNDTITQTGLNSYVRGIKLEITCDTTAIKYHNIEYLGADEVFHPLNLTLNFEKRANGYTFFFAENEIRAIGNGDAHLNQDESLIIRESLSYHDCSRNPELSYQMYYGDGSNWCAKHL